MGLAGAHLPYWTLGEGGSRGVGTGAAAQAAAVVASTSYREEELGAATVEWGSEPAMERVVCVSLLHAA